METVEIIAAFVGLLYLWLEYKADVWLWMVGMVMPILYIYIFFQSKFYADMGINIYYLGAGIYGWWYWRSGKRKTETDGAVAETFPFTHVSIQIAGRLSAIFVVLFALIAFILVRFTDSPVAYGDAFTTALSIIGMWMLAKKYIEQWWVWFVVNAISATLYFSKSLYPTFVLYAMYTIVSILGYFKWKHLMIKELQ